MPETATFNMIFDAKHYLKVATFDKNTNDAVQVPSVWTVTTRVPVPTSMLTATIGLSLSLTVTNT